MSRRSVTVQPAISYEQPGRCRFSHQPVYLAIRSIDRSIPLAHRGSARLRCSPWPAVRSGIWRTSYPPFRALPVRQADRYGHGEGGAGDTIIRIGRPRAGRQGAVALDDLGHGEADRLRVSELGPRRRQRIGRIGRRHLSVRVLQNLALPRHVAGAKPGVGPTGPSRDPAGRALGLTLPPPTTCANPSASRPAGVVKLVDTPDLGSGGVSRGGSSPSARTSRPCSPLSSLWS